VAYDVAAVVGAAGWATAEDLLRRVSPRTLGTWVAAGRLVRLRPGVFALPDAAGSWRTRVTAALAGREAVASWVTALALWELAEHPPGAVHVSVEPSRSARGSRGVMVHRSPGAYADRRRVHGLPVSPVERALVDVWGRPVGVHRSDVRAAAIVAVRRRLCSAADLGFELSRQPRLPGRAELAPLVDLLADGCQSELEIWGCLHVLRAPGMPPFVQQRRVSVGGETFVLDAACEEVMLAIEMDGAAWHGSRQQRERDIRRDAVLATVGWQTMRFSYDRLTRQPERCQGEIRAAHAARLRLFAGHGVH
jgi:very-short-patch-repair endonuclease